MGLREKASQANSSEFLCIFAGKEGFMRVVGYWAFSLFSQGQRIEGFESGALARGRIWR